MSSKIRSLQRARDRKQVKEGEIAINLNQALNSAGSLGTLLGKEEIPIRQSFLIGKIAKQVSAEIESYQASRKILCEKYADKDPQGKAKMIDGEGNPVKEGESGRYDIPAEKMADFNREHAELLTVEVSISGVKIKASDLSDVKIAPAHLMNLDWLIGD